MRTITVNLLFGAISLFALPASQLVADVVLPAGLTPGSQYQLIFVTADPHNAVSFNISDYNDFVSSEAAPAQGFPPA